MIREEEGVKTNQGNDTEHPMEARPRTTSLIKDLNRNFFSKAESQILEKRKFTGSHKNEHHVSRQ